MDCKTFQLQINKFIHLKMKDDYEVRDFIEHARNCPECYEELEIYFTLLHGLDLLDENSLQVIDFHKELENMLDAYYDGACISIRVKHISGITTFLAMILSWVVLAAYIIYLI